MKTIVFINSQKSGSSREAIKAADRLGYYTVLLTNKMSFVQKRTEFPDVHNMKICKINDINKIRNAINELIAKALDIKLIISFVDPYCSIANTLCGEFCDNKFSANAIAAMEDKILSRQIIEKTQYCPRYMSISKNSILSKDDIDSRLPLIMKSPNSTGSKDVFKIDDYESFKLNRDFLQTKYPNDPILLEEFLDGPQYLIETVVADNEVHIIAIIEQEITFNKRFIITGYNLMITPQLEFYRGLKQAVKTIIDKHGMKSGTCHLEMRYINDGWKLIEINPRISGAGMNNFIEIGLGLNLVEETLKYALGLEYNLKPRHKFNCFAQYVTLSEKGILRKVTGRSKAEKSPEVKSVYIKPRKGAFLTPPLSMGNRYAYVIAIGDNEEEATLNAKNAASKIEFHLLACDIENEITSNRRNLARVQKNEYKRFNV